MSCSSNESSLFELLNPFVLGMFCVYFQISHRFISREITEPSDLGSVCPRNPGVTVSMDVVCFIYLSRLETVATRAGFCCCLIADVGKSECELQLCI